MKITKIENAGKHNVYDIEVEKSKHYILENGLASHNSGAKYAASTIITLSKSKDKDGTDVVGNLIRATTYKSRYTKENQQIQMQLDFTTGLNRYYGLYEVCDEYDLIEKVSALKYKLPDGTEVKSKQLRENFEKYCTPELLDKIDEALKIKYSLGLGEKENQNSIDDEEEEIDNNEVE